LAVHGGLWSVVVASLAAFEVLIPPGALTTSSPVRASRRLAQTEDR
jgi:hypothetical protein